MEHTESEKDPTYSKPILLHLQQESSRGDSSCNFSPGIWAPGIYAEQLKNRSPSAARGTVHDIGQEVDYRMLSTAEEKPGFCTTGVI